MIALAYTALFAENEKYLAVCEVYFRSGVGKETSSRRVCGLRWSARA